MPIEKLEQVDVYRENQILELNFRRKINELIDAFNTREQDRSEQMARFILRMEKLENQMDLTRDYLHEHDNRLTSLENATQPKEEETIIRSKNIDISDKMIKTWKKFHEENKLRWNEEESILECPFCQKEKYIEVLEHNDGKFCVRCLPCRARGSEKDTKQEAIKSWNTRK